MARSAAFMVLDHIPDDEEMEDWAYTHLEDFEAEQASATVDIVYEAPRWLATHEQDQINAHMRDGGVCILVIYMTDEECYDEEEE
jgi:hypothetical protein